MSNVTTTPLPLSGSVPERAYHSVRPEARVRLLRAPYPRRRPSRGPDRATARPQDEDARSTGSLGRRVPDGRSAGEPRGIPRRRANRPAVSSIDTGANTGGVPVEYRCQTPESDKCL